MPEQDISARDASWLAQAVAGDDHALEALLEAYKPLVLSRAAQYCLVLSSWDDLVQEGMIALFQAIRKCPRERWTSFSSYAFHAVDNRMLDLLRQEQSQKMQALIKSLPLDAPKESDKQELSLKHGDTIKGKGQSPEDNFIAGESIADLAHAIEELLSPQEAAILLAASRGQSYKTIAGHYGLSTKAVDSSLQRSRKKLRGYLEERET